MKNNILKISIIKEPTKSKPYLIIFKPSGLPSAPLSKEDKNNALSQAIELYPQIQNVVGLKEIEYGLIHRLDTVTSGLIIIATTNECYQALIKQQKLNKIKKYYQAECNINFDNCKNVEGFEDYTNKSENNENENYSNNSKEQLEQSEGIEKKEETSSSNSSSVDENEEK